MVFSNDWEELKANHLLWLQLQVATLSSIVGTFLFSFDLNSTPMAPLALVVTKFNPGSIEEFMHVVGVIAHVALAFVSLMMIVAFANFAFAGHGLPLLRFLVGF
jgi:hypothetical protein